MSKRHKRDLRPPCPHLPGWLMTSARPELSEYNWNNERRILGRANSGRYDLVALSRWERVICEVAALALSEIAQASQRDATCTLSDSSVIHVNLHLFLSRKT